MPNVTIYTTQVCPYCDRAKELLQRKSVSYNEVKVDSDKDQLSEMLAKSNGRRTVPQIFIDDTHVGGCDDLYALDAADKLDKMLEI